MYIAIMFKNCRLGVELDMKVEIWYHDPVEVDPQVSWVANSPYIIQNASFNEYPLCKYSKVLALNEYTRPDFIVTLDGEPIIVVEVSKENPSGHNIPQRFACMVRAAELGIPSLMYFPVCSRRTASNPGVRYLNVRVPLAQLRMSEIYNVPCLTMRWPTGPDNLPSSNIHDHAALAKFVEHVINSNMSGKKLDRSDAFVCRITQEMKRLCIPRQVSAYPRNSTYRIASPAGEPFSNNLINMSIDPPSSCQVYETTDFLKQQFSKARKSVPNSKKLEPIKARKYTLLYKGTANKSKTGPEHPYPGYLTLLDILYLRDADGQTSHSRSMNLAFSLPISLEAFKDNAINRPTGLNIIMEFADLILLDNALVLAGWMRNIAAGAVLIEW